MSRKRQKKTLFLIGKNKSPGENSKRNLLTSKLNHINLLHSDKGTYFYKYSKLGLVLPALALLGLVNFIINPIKYSLFSSDNNNKAYAAEPDPDFSIQLSLGDTIQTEEQLDTGIIGYIENNFTISSTATESYSIYLQPAEGYTNNLVGRKYNDITIPGVGDNVSVANFTNNTWGYGLSETNSTSTANSSLTYSTIPDGITPIKTVSNPDDGNDTYKLVFAARIGDDKPADHYESQALLSVAASPKAVAVTWDSIQYMQEMTSDICASMPEADGDTNQIKLKDGRDNKEYYVAKLKDGNCWMTQNLDLDLNGVTLKSNNSDYKGSDVTADWTSTTGASALWSDTSGTTIKYYSPDSNTGANHASKGNYYSFNAATAGKGQNVTGSNANVENSSICPAGWQLPLSGSSNTLSTSSADKSFGKLLGTYGVTSNSAGYNILIKAPLYFIASGFVYSGSVYGTSDGYYWSATSFNSVIAYYLYFNSSYVGPADSNVARYDGMSVRCVAR